MFAYDESFLSNAKEGGEGRRILDRSVGAIRKCSARSTGENLPRVGASPRRLYCNRDSLGLLYSVRSALDQLRIVRSHRDAARRRRRRRERFEKVRHRFRKFLPFLEAAERARPPSTDGYPSANWRKGSRATANAEPGEARAPRVRIKPENFHGHRPDLITRYRVRSVEKKSTREKERERCGARSTCERAAESTHKKETGYQIKTIRRAEAPEAAGHVISIPRPIVGGIYSEATVHIFYNRDDAGPREVAGTLVPPPRCAERSRASNIVSSRPRSVGRKKNISPIKKSDEW